MNESEVFDKAITLLSREVGGISDDFFPSRLPFLGWVLAAIGLVASFNGKGQASVWIVGGYFLVIVMVLIWLFVNAFRTNRFYRVVVPFITDLIEEVKASPATGGAPVIPSTEALSLRIEKLAYFSCESRLVVACSLRVCLLSYRP